VSLFETERLSVRRWAVDDVDAVLSIYGDEEVTRFLGTAPNPIRDPEVARAWLERIVSRSEDHIGLWALQDKVACHVIGSVGLFALDGGPDIEVAYHLGRAYWGSGFATEAARGALAHGFETGGLSTIHAVAYTENAASLRVLERIGMTHRGHRRAYDHDLEWYSAHRATWRATP
jgi:RimJ/RimL family protein N-acetyltransferase